MDNPNDKQSHEAKKHLKDAFIQLLKTKDLASVTVKDIIEQAHYNRSTFYYHFQDKEDLIRDLKNELIMDFEKLFVVDSRNEENPNSIKHVSIIDYVYKHKEYFSLWKYNIDVLGFNNLFIDKMISMSQEYYQHGSSSTGVESDMLTTFRAYGTLGLIIDWIKSDFRETPENMSDQVRKILTMKTSFNKFFRKK